jgi:hypothetical protein
MPTIMLDHPAVSPTRGHLVFRQVGNNFDDRPLPRGGAACELLHRSPANKRTYLGCRLPLNREWIFAFDIPSEPLAILFGRFGHACS